MAREPHIGFPGLTALALAAMLPAMVAASAGPPAIELPPDWESRFIRIATVDDPDRGIVRHVHLNPEAHARLRPGEPAPHGTLLIMADARARLDAAGRPLLDAGGRFVAEPGWIALFAQRKEPGGGAAHPPWLRNGDWDFAAFDGAGRPRDISPAPCLACHKQARAAQDFTFILWDYAATQGGR